MTASPLLLPYSPASLFGAAAGTLRAAAVRLRLWRDRARQRADLAELDERMLRDVGLTSHDVLRETGKAPWRA